MFFHPHSLEVQLVYTLYLSHHASPVEIFKVLAIDCSSIFVFCLLFGFLNWIF